MPRLLCRLLLLWFLPTIIPSRALADDWPQWLGPQRDGVWRETGILDKFPPGGPPVLWRTQIGGGFTGPGVAGERVYVMDRQGDKPARGVEAPGKNGLPGSERVLCLNRVDGKVLWKHEYDCPYKIYYPSGPRTTPVVRQGKVYTLGAMGDLYGLDAATGKVHWSKNFIKDYRATPPIWGWSAHLLVDGDKVVSLVGGEGSAVVAFHKDTGKELWRALTIEEIGYTPPMIYEAGGKRQLIIWHSEAVNSLDPETGSLYWSIPFPSDVKPVRPAITISSPRKEGDLLFITSVHHGPLMLRLTADKPGASVLWKGGSNNVGKPDGLHSMMTTPMLRDGHIYGVCAFGELRCLEAATGKRLWETYAATTGKKTFFATAFLVEQGDRTFLFNEQGDLIIARLTPKGYEEIDRAHLLEPTLTSRGREVVWSHPAFAHRCVYVRNDKEIICVSLAS
jgi:outer membrane protein assembly factor BamB